MMTIFYIDTEFNDGNLYTGDIFELACLSSREECTRQKTGDENCDCSKCFNYSDISIIRLGLLFYTIIFGFEIVQYTYV